MSDAEKSGLVAKLIGPRKRWRAYKARVSELPDGYRTAAEAVERYLMNFVPADTESSTAMFEDLADLFEQAAAEGTPVRDVVGEDPADFVDAFAANYSDGGYTPARTARPTAGSFPAATTRSPRRPAGWAAATDSAPPPTQDSPRSRAGATPPPHRLLNPPSSRPQGLSEVRLDLVVDRPVGAQPAVVEAGGGGVDGSGESHAARGVDDTVAG